MTQVGAHDIDRFRYAIVRKLGLHFDDAKLDFLGDVLRRRLGAVRQPADAYLAALESSYAGAEIGALAQELTVPETYFFRHTEQYRALAEVALPERMRVEGASKRLRILSAGCASGEEAYSLAILVREAVDPSWDVSILAVDLNPAMLAKARSGRYSAWSLRETPPDICRRWFTRDGRDFMLDASVRDAVRFEARNLAQEDAELWQPGAYDVVFFRNVLMYFTPDTQHAVIARLARSLKPGGYLFLGHAETLRGLSNEFHLLHTHGTFYYQNKAGTEHDSTVRAGRDPSHSAARAIVPLIEESDSWVDVIRSAAERIENLTAPAQAVPARRPRRELAGTPIWDLQTALDLLRQERFAEALETMKQLPAEAERDADVLLLSAALLTHTGELGRAEAACRRLLGVEELNAGAHYLLALCREGAHDRAGAVHHDQLAAYLDPGFAMPHLHLGLLARRAGDFATAQSELRQAQSLLQREDASRVLLFGGGFGREMLVALCEMELAACGGTGVKRS